MAMPSVTVKQVMILVFVVVGILLFIFLFGVLTGNKLARALACGILFWVPFGALATAFAHGCAAVPV